MFECGVWNSFHQEGRPVLCCRPTVTCSKKERDATFCMTRGGRWCETVSVQVPLALETRKRVAKRNGVLVDSAEEEEEYAHSSTSKNHGVVSGRLIWYRVRLLSGGRGGCEVVKRIGGLAGRFGAFAVKYAACRRRRIGVKVIMTWWRKKVVFPVKRAWLAVAARVKTQKSGGGILKLHDDVQMCGYEDVQVMWEMLRKSELELSAKQRKRPFWQLPATWNINARGANSSSSSSSSCYAPPSAALSNQL